MQLFVVKSILVCGHPHHCLYAAYMVAFHTDHWIVHGHISAGNVPNRTNALISCLFDIGGIFDPSGAVSIDSMQYLCHIRFLQSGVDILTQSWVTTKKTEISVQHEFLKPIYLCVYIGIVLTYLDVHQKC